MKVFSVTTTPHNKVKALRLVNELDHEDKVECIAVAGPMLVSCVQVRCSFAKLLSHVTCRGFEFKSRAFHIYLRFFKSRVFNPPPYQGSSVVVWDWDAMEVLHTVDYTHHDVSRVIIWSNHIVLMGVSVVYLDSRTFQEGLTRRFDTNIKSCQVCPAPLQSYCPDYNINTVVFFC